MVLHKLDKNGIDLCLFMKLFALILTLVALAPFVTGCSFAITPLIFLIDNNEIGSGHEASYAGRKEENRHRKLHAEFASVGETPSELHTL